MGGRGRACVHPGGDDFRVAEVVFEVGEEPEGEDELAEVVEVLEGLEERFRDGSRERENGAAIVAADLEFGNGGRVMGGDGVEERGTRRPAVGGMESEGIRDVGSVSKRR